MGTKTGIGVGVIIGLIVSLICAEPVRNLSVVGLEMRAFEVGCHIGARQETPTYSRLERCIRASRTFRDALLSAVETK